MTPDASPDDEPLRQPPLAVSVITVADFAKALGVDSGFIILADHACRRHMDCRRERGRPYVSVNQCEQGLLDVWCPSDVCRGEFAENIENDPCTQAALAVSCDALDTVIDCPMLRDKGLVFRATDWPRGAMPPETQPDRNGMYPKTP